MQPFMTVPPEELGQADLRLPAIAVCAQIDLLIFDRAPEPLHQDVFVGALSARQADLDLLRLQSDHQVGRGELAALIRVEELQLAPTFQRGRQSIKSELRVKAA